MTEGVVMVIMMVNFMMALERIKLTSLHELSLVAVVMVATFGDHSAIRSFDAIIMAMIAATNAVTIRDFVKEAWKK